MTNSNYTNPSSDESSVDSSDDENFRRPVKVRSSIEKMGPQTQSSMAPAPQQQAFSVHNVCFANGTEYADEVVIPRNLSLIIPPVRMEETSKNLNFYEEVIIPRLRDCGWEFSPADATVTPLGTASTVKISKSALIKITKALDIDRALCNKNEANNLGYCITKKLKEEILLSRTQSSIDIQDVVKKSCSLATPKHILMCSQGGASEPTGIESASPELHAAEVPGMKSSAAEPAVAHPLVVKFDDKPDATEPSTAERTATETLPESAVVEPSDTTFSTTKPSIPDSTLAKNIANASGNKKTFNKDAPLNDDGHQMLPSSVASRKRDRATYENEGINRTTSQESQDKETAKFVKCRKVIPKCTTNKFGSEEIFPPTFLSEAVKKVFEELEKPSPPLRQKLLLNAQLLNDTTDSLSLILQAKGRDDLVNSLLKLVGKRVNSIQARENVNTVLRDKKSLEIDVKIDVTKDLGMKAIKPFGSNREDPGIWISSTSTGGQFQNIFGVGTNSGAVLTKIGKKRVYKLSDKNRLLSKAKFAYERSGKKVNKWTSITVCLNRNADLQHLDKKRVIFTNGIPIRYRDGNSYRGKWKIEPSSPQTHHKLSAKKKTSAKPSKETHRALPQKLHKEKSEPNLFSSTTKSTPKFRNEEDQPVSRPGSLQKFGSDSCLVVSNPKDTTNLKSRPKTPYEKFREKIHLARDIEFKHAMVHSATANGSMWNEHKVLYGNSCEKNCPCVSNLMELSRNVVEDFKEGQIEEDQKWCIPTGLKTGVYPVGFMSSFCSKFFDRVREQFSEDTAEETLSKIIVMWNEHTKDRSYGLKCTDDCPCDEAWDKLFLPACTRHEKCKADSNQTPARQKRTGQMVDAMSERDEFEITFNPSKESLGFYCETRKISNSNDCSCVILSIDPGGTALKKDSQIRIGTVIDSSEAVTTFGKKLRIESHFDLKVRYEAMKRSVGMKNRLKLHFKNPATRRWNLDLIPGNNWSETGAWIGMEKDGWAGGAMGVHVEDKKSAHELHTTTSNKPASEDERFRLPKKRKPITAPDACNVDSGMSQLSNQMKSRIRIKASVVKNNIERMKADLNVQKKVRQSISSKIECKNDVQTFHKRKNDKNDIAKVNNSKSCLVEKEVTSVMDERRIAFLKLSGIYIPKISIPSSTQQKAPTTPCNSTNAIKKVSSGNTTQQTNQSLSPSAPKDSSTHLAPISILRKPGLPKIEKKVTFASKLTSEEKCESSAIGKTSESNKIISLSSNTPITENSAKNNPYDNGVQPNRNTHVDGSVATKSSSESEYFVNDNQDNGNKKFGRKNAYVANCMTSDSPVGIGDNGNGQNIATKRTYNSETKHGVSHKKKCENCFLMLQKDSFSKNQWRKPFGRKCKRCLSNEPNPNTNLYVADENLYQASSQLRQDHELKHCSSCPLLLKENEFSKKQWRSGKSKRCKSCISDGFQQQTQHTPRTHCNNSSGRGYEASTFHSSLVGREHASNQTVSFGSSIQPREERNEDTLPPTRQPEFSSGLDELEDHSSSDSDSMSSPETEVVNVSLHRTMEEMKIYLEEHQPSGNLIASALNVVKKRNIDGSDDILKNKAVILKIYSNIFYLLAKARDLKDHHNPSSNTYTDERKLILKELYEKATWIEQFQKRERSDNKHTILNGHITLRCGFTMLHAAVILSDERVTAKIMAVGAYPMACCSRWGSVIDLSWNLRKEASIQDNRGIECTQRKIHDELEHYQKVACAT